MTEKKRPPFLLAMRELKEAQFALNTIVDLVETGKVEDALRTFPSRECGMRIGIVIAMMRVASSGIYRLCSAVAYHTNLPAANKLINRS